MCCYLWTCIRTPLRAEELLPQLLHIRLLCRVESADLFRGQLQNLNEHCLESASPLSQLTLWSSGSPARAACVAGGRAGGAAAAGGG